MSGNRKGKSDEGSGGLGFGAAVLVGAGAAALGFLARDLWNSYQETQSQSSGSQPRPPPPAPPTTNWGSKANETSNEKMGARKKNRKLFKDQNLPDEMKCIVCCDNPREICLVPCGHVCLCEDCADKIPNTCPLCGVRIVEKKVVYL